MLLKLLKAHVNNNNIPTLTFKEANQIKFVLLTSERIFFSKRNELSYTSCLSRIKNGGKSTKCN